MPPRAVWVLNLDAEHELAGGGTPGASVRRAVEAARPAARRLLGEGELDVDQVRALGVDARGAPGRAWCPTPRALDALRSVGAEPPDAPALEVLRSVNHRRFCARLGDDLPGARFAASPAEVLDAVRAAPPRETATDTWLLKRPLVAAGRGQRRVRAGDPEPGDRAWIEAARDGLQVEPRVVLALELALHGELDRRGGLRRGRATVHEPDAGGSWRASRLPREDELDPELAGALAAELERTAAALHAAGYFGPFGIDAFLWRGAGGAPRLRARSEINARYTLGWPLGMAETD